MPVRPQYREAVAEILPDKDLDALTRHGAQQNPATSEGIVRLAEPHLKRDSKIVILGGEGFVGSGVVRILRARGFNPVIIDIGDSFEPLRNADVVISTVGQAGFLTAERLGYRARALIVDSGFTPTRDGARGDVASDAVGLAHVLTPVPGGVGPTEMSVLAERILVRDFGATVPRWRYDGENIVFERNP